MVKFRLSTWKRKHLLKNLTTYIHQIYSNGLLKLKNMDWFIVYASIYMNFCVWILFGIYYGDSIYDIFKFKKSAKKLLEKNYQEKYYGLLNGLKWAIFS